MNENSTNPLTILETAISDVGVWTWYSAELPEYLQLEFNWTQLLQTSPDPKAPPPSHVALQFEALTAVVLLEDEDPDLPENWLEQMAKDELTPEHINDEQFSFQPEEVADLIRSAGKTKNIFGSIDVDKLGESKDIVLGFRAGSRGIVVKAGQMGLANIDGAMPFEDVAELHEQWWAYWEKYWSVRDDKSVALPYDPICEVVIPVSEDQIEEEGAVNE